jgi:hypothetical protein
MFLRVDISNLVPAVFSDIVAILTAPAVNHKNALDKSGKELSAHVSKSVREMRC